MKSTQIPPAAVWGIIGVLVLIVVVFMYSSFVKPPAQTDPATISATRLEDPDPPRAPK